jgi:hypothetical protein
MNDMVCTRLDLAHTISVVSKFLSNLGQQYWDAIKWIFKYLRVITDYNIMFNRQQDNPLVVGYVDTDYVRDFDYKRSPTGCVFTLVGSLFVGSPWFNL